MAYVEAVAHAFAPILLDDDTGGGNLGETRDIQITPDGQYALMASRASRFTIMDISDPTSISLAGVVLDATTLQAAQGSDTQGDVSVVAATTFATSGTGGFVVVDHSTKTAPAVIGSIANPTSGVFQDALKGALEVVWPNQYAYVTSSDGNAVAVIDMAVPASPAIVTKITHATMAQPQGVDFRTIGAQDVLFVGDSNQLQAWNVTNPLSPALLSGSASQPAAMSQIHAYSDTHVAAISNGAADSITVFNVSNLSAVAVADTLVEANLDRPLGVTVTTDGIAMVPCQSNTGVLGFVDVTDPTNIVYLGRLEQPTPGVTDMGSGELYHCFTAAVSPLDEDIIGVAVAGGARLTMVDLQRTVDPGPGPTVPRIVKINGQAVNLG